MRVCLSVGYYFVLIFIFGCGPSESELSQVEYNRRKKNNEMKLYYPISYDDWYFSYEPNLKGAEGWVTNNCEEKGFNREGFNHLGQRVKVKNAALKHKLHGTYDGIIKVVSITETGSIIDSSEFWVGFTCFKPDFEKGEWLSKRYWVSEK